MNKELCIIVIPIHSENPSKNELISFEQCFNILGKHQIKIIAPNNISLSQYQKVVPDFEVVPIDPLWQSSLINYNKLKLSHYFYDLFKDYEYLLTYELDSFVFKDELLEWCYKGYDYIGAPWLEDGLNNDAIIVKGVGNSGFSLRKISTMKKCLKRIYFKDPIEYQAGRLKKMYAYSKVPIYYFLRFWGENRTLQNASFFNEDWILCSFLQQNATWTNLSTIEDAIKFSFEANPYFLFKLNNMQLPMGCHAWWKYDLSFWKPHIEKFGYKLDN